MQFLKVRNWEAFQHYNKRNPPWIKVHNQLLTDYEFSCLQDASKAHLMLIWLLASQTENKFPNDPAWIQKKIGSSQKPDCNLLIECGFLEVIAGCEQDASKVLVLDRDRGETEDNKHGGHQGKNSCPYQKIVDLYHKTLPTLPRVEKLTPNRKSYIRNLWQQDLKELDNWFNFFDYVSQSPFLMGKSPPGNGHRPFMANLEWITKPANFVKITEENYHG